MGWVGTASSVTRLGDWAIFELLGNKFAYKSGPKTSVTFGLFCKVSLYVKTTVATFGNVSMKEGM